MINKIATPLLLMLILLSGCLKDPDPIPETIDTYQKYYNYFLEPYAIQWDIDDEILGTGHAYGIPAEAIIILDQAEQELLIQALDSDSGLLLDSLSYTMLENGAYMTAILGSEEEPHLLCEPIDTRPPASGMVLYNQVSRRSSQGSIEKGATVTKNRELVVIPDLSKMKVRLKVPEFHISKIKNGQLAYVTIESIRSDRLKAKARPIESEEPQTCAVRAVSSAFPTAKSNSGKSRSVCKSNAVRNVAVVTKVCGAPGRGALGPLAIRSLNRSRASRSRLTSLPKISLSPALSIGW